MDDSIIPYPVRSYLYFSNKKHRIYTVCGVSQTPKIMIICEVLEISPYELLLETDSKNPKEYKQMDYVVIDKNSREYELIQKYERLDPGARKRLDGYLQALSDME
ncbi:hypothetical protein [Sellimonas catena]|uniref:hypothetical protein n=1 Tax=Sellimonas catena TaxID=2994035 RepID=UPI003862DC0A